MKNWALTFFSVFLVVALLPITVTTALKERPITKMTIFENGETITIDLEEYALRVLLGEGANCKSMESKKALAVSARTLGAYFSFYGCKHTDFSACTDGNCCLSLGSYENADEDFLNDCITAVNETKGEILTHENLPVLSLFTLCSGSGTAQSDELFYLSPTYNETICEEHKSVQSFEKSGLLDGVDDQNSCIVYAENGKCEFLILNGKKIDALDCITQMKIPSTEFVLWLDGDSVRAESNGIGHGFGLDICGSEKLSQNGNNYKEILGFYFPRLNLNKIY